MNVFFINGYTYFTTITGKVNYTTIRRCRGRCRNDILKRLQAIVDHKTKRGFQVNVYYADNEFKKIEEYLVPSTLHTQAAGEHEPTLNIKDRTDSTVHSVPYRKMPLMMIDSIA